MSLGKLAEMDLMTGSVIAFALEPLPALLSILDKLNQPVFKFRTHLRFFILGQPIFKQLTGPCGDIPRCHLKPIGMVCADAQVRGKEFLSTPA